MNCRATPTLLLLLRLAFAAEIHYSTDVIRDDIPDEETALSPEDFDDNFEEVSVEQILANRLHSKADISRDPVEQLNRVEGDILIEDQRRFTRSAIREPWQHWPRGQVPYTISNKYGPYSRKVIARAIKRFHEESCIRFVPKRSDDRHYVFIHPEDGCYSVVGRIGGKQPISLDGGCLEVGTVMHELMHVTGFFHEQNRPDRDEYIDITWNNIVDEGKDQFEKYESWLVLDLGKYDYGSLMHYSQYAFSKDPFRKVTIKALKKGGSKMGQRKDFSREDLSKLLNLYDCSAGDTDDEWPDLPGGVELCEDTTLFCIIETLLGCDTKEVRRKCPESCKSCGKQEEPETSTEDGTCRDANVEKCAWRKEQGHCDDERQFMLLNCPKLCGFCESAVEDQQTNQPKRRQKGCEDLNEHCDKWQRDGYCDRFTGYMESACPRACNTCVL